MQFSQIHYCSLAVKDLERASAFYRDVLGLLEIAIPSTFPAAGLNVRWFQIGDQQIHLVLESQNHPPSKDIWRFKSMTLRPRGRVCMRKGLPSRRPYPSPARIASLLQTPMAIASKSSSGKKPMSLFLSVGI